MRLLIISNMPHHLRDGEVVGWGATVRELDRLATRFDHVRHIASLYREPAPASAIAYAAPNLELVPVPPSGAAGVRGKLDVLRASPTYIRTILRELADADVVHVRGPANLALLAMLILSVRRRPAARWFKYAGNWQPTGRESPSYTFQRWWLARGWLHGTVTVSGTWPAQPPWIRTLFNPSLEDRDLERGRASAATKVLTQPLRLVFVGRVEAVKGAGRALHVVRRLLDHGVAVRLELIGGGDEQPAIEQLAITLGVGAHVAFRGWQPPAAVYDALAAAHFLLLPSASEGWPKVVSEGMAYGVVPLASAVSSIPQYLERFGTGVALPADDVAGFADAIEAYVATPARWAAESARAVDGARWFSFAHYLESLDALLAELGVDAPRAGTPETAEAAN